MAKRRAIPRPARNSARKPQRRRANPPAEVEPAGVEGLLPLQVRVPASLLAQLRTIATARRNAGSHPYTHQALGLEAIRWVVEKYA